MTRLLDFSEPIGLLMVAVLHFVPDEKDPRGVVARYRDALPVGSLVALSYLTVDRKPNEMAGVAEAMKKSRDPVYFRSYAEVRALFEGLESIWSLDGVVPVAVEVMACEGYGLLLLVGELDFGGVKIEVEVG
ncbi:MAG: SAM-dependent methyltransferase, partial [Actinomycetota bacterium]|nr:SAM-dependent methyltransferase [Actinomycetota bacterium]